MAKHSAMASASCRKAAAAAVEMRWACRLASSTLARVSQTVCASSWLKRIPGKVVTRAAAAANVSSPRPPPPPAPEADEEEPEAAACSCWSTCQRYMSSPRDEICILQTSFARDCLI